MLDGNITEDNDHLTSSYRYYRTLLEQQAQIDHSNILRHRADALFRACPGLTSMWVTYGDPISTICNSKSFQKGLVLPHDNRAANVDEGILAPIQLLLAAADSGRKLTTVVFGNVHYNLLLQPANIQSKIASVMERVEQFQWDIGDTFSTWNPSNGEEDDNGVINDAGDDFDEDEVYNMYGIFARGAFLTFLSKFQVLRDLAVSLPGMSYRLAPIELRHVVGGIHFPLLEAFYISSVLTTSDDLIGFLLRHKETLKRLRLCDLSMSTDKDDSWNSFFAGIAGKLPKLELISLRGIFSHYPQTPCYVFGWYAPASDGTPFTTRMERYVLSGQGEVPQQASNPLDESEREKRLGSAAVPKALPLTWKADAELSIQ
ncbi:uncharacterized protein MYCFIDRAFT_197618 [Pseudocercospora fijiensis CIRAD86]|uniref:Uncharacterized protein n=1 Tax=Pseudocercospora fijiensis (strain CIRAD86) TaxID=383855 RepID=M2YXV8_PSEFD|nr:uncharacterized protein MYCFIDRAFT_197618 [Pseudocercospora fijiensis CIRAD86]EME82520.1 hypothetical protein MYCFIDRAFT_197618 [Pseudocercospora fijiensis CIRAD86]